MNLINTSKADLSVVEELEQTPLNMYDTLIFLSVKDHPTKMEQDFVCYGGERHTEIMVEHFAQMLYRHPEFKQFVTKAMLMAAEIELDETIGKQ